MKKKNRIILSTVIGVISSVIAFIVVLSSPSGNSLKEIRKVEYDIEQACKDIGKSHKFTNPETGKAIDITYFGLSWDKINELTSSLTYSNRRIAKAKILTRHQENPIPEYSYEDELWEDRFNISKQPWIVESLLIRIIKAVGMGIMWLFIGFIIILSLLYMVPFIWYYSLRRIKELSLSIQGKDIK